MATAEGPAPDGPVRSGAGPGAPDRGPGGRRRGARPRTAGGRRAPGSLLLLVVYGAATALAVAALAWTAARGVAAPGTALAFGALIAVGEAVRCGVTAPEQVREPAPLAAVGALGYAVHGQVADAGGAFGPLQAVAVVVAASLVGLVPLLALGHPAGLDHLARRVLAIALAALCCQSAAAVGGLAGRHLDEPYALVGLLLLLGLAALGETVLAVLVVVARGGCPSPARPGGRPPAQLGTAAVVYAAAVVLALAVAVAGPWALPSLGVPLLAAQVSARRCAVLRATDRQTVASLARATEIAGYTPPGHARRVARLGQEVARELGLSERARTVLESAALLHDVGQLSLVEPCPGGATEPLSAPEAQRIARLGGAVVRQTGISAEVALVVERQAAPYREQPLAARILRVVNAYADLTGDLGAPCGGGAAVAGRPRGGEDGSAGPDPGLDDEVTGGSPRAMERLWLGTEREYDPVVVAALARVLRRTRVR